MRRRSRFYKKGTAPGWIPGDIAIARLLYAKLEIPGIPAGTTAIGAGGSTSAGAGPSIGARACRKILAAGDTGIGPWTVTDSSLDHIGLVAVYRGQHATPIGTLAGSFGSILSGGQPIVRYDANAIAGANSWAVLIGERNANLANMNANPGAAVHRGFGNTGNTLAQVLKDTNAEVASWAQTDVIYNAANTAYGDIVIELAAASAGSLQFIGVQFTANNLTLALPPSGTPPIAMDTRHRRYIVMGA